MFTLRHYKFMCDKITLKLNAVYMESTAEREGRMTDRENKTDYRLMLMQLRELSAGVSWDITVLANASALLWESLDDINWAGFYLLRDGKLLLGPFQGRTACTAIEPGRGVCGAAAAGNTTMLVPDVHEFPGHIACDSASSSEIVIPLHTGGNVYGVLDIDSPIKGRFTEEDKNGLEAFASGLETILHNIHLSK